jgi:hypothetical protein
MSPELQRSGYAWVGVSAQKASIEGGANIVGVPGTPQGGLRGTNPERYGALHHPGDAFAFDMFSQIGRAIRGDAKPKPLGPQRLIAAGESQSALALTTYIDAIQPIAHVFDGFFVHSRGVGAFPIEGGSVTSAMRGSVAIRTDIDVPVLMLETETDEAWAAGLLPGPPARHRPHPSVGRGRRSTRGHLARARRRRLRTRMQGTNQRGSDALRHRSGIARDRHLDPRGYSNVAGASDGRAHGARCTGDPARCTRHWQGRHPHRCRRRPGRGLLGDRRERRELQLHAVRTRPVSKATRAGRYPTRAAYVSAVTKATDEAIDHGWLLPVDGAEIIAAARRVEL